MEEKLARAIYSHLVGIEHLIERLPRENKLMFSASIIQHSNGDFVSFDLVGRDSEEVVFRYHNITVDENTNNVVRARGFVAKNLKSKQGRSESE